MSGQRLKNNKYLCTDHPGQSLGAPEKDSTQLQTASQENVKEVHQQTWKQGNKSVSSAETERKKLHPRTCRETAHLRCKPVCIGTREKIPPHSQLMPERDSEQEVGWTHKKNCWFGPIAVSELQEGHRVSPGKGTNVFPIH